MKKFFLISILFFLTTESTFSQKSTRIGYIDMKTILGNIDEYKIAQKLIDERIKSWQKEIELKKLQLKKYQDELNLEKVLLTPELIEDRNDEISDFAKSIVSLQERRFGLNGDLVKQRLRLIKPIQDQVLTAVREIAVERKYDFIFDRSSELIMLYSVKNYDISDLVLRKISIQQRNKERKKLIEERKLKQKKK
ncbi:MAG: OmpH family outer membrane protein [Flavobacteriaceae bacterium]